jgi:hypothetical protein
MNNEPQLDSLLKQMADGHQPELPSPGLIWWRAQILKKYEQKKRIERPITVMRLAVTVLFLVLLAALVAANWEQFQTLLGREGWLLMPLAIAALTASLVSAALLWSVAKGR